MITWVLCFVTIALIGKYLVSHWKERRIFDPIPGPKSWPLIGNALNVRGSPVDIWNLLQKFSDVYYPIFKLWIATFPIVVTRHPDDVEKILGNPNFIRRGKFFTFLEPWGGTGLVTSLGAKWRKRRKILAPAFHLDVLQKYLEVFVEEGEHMSKFLKKEGGQVVNDLLPLISEHSLNMFCDAALGHTLRSNKETQQAYIKAVHGMEIVTMQRLMKPLWHSDFIFRLVPAGWRQTKFLKVLHGFTRTIISERKGYHDQTGGKYLMDLDEKNANEDLENENNLGVRKRRLALLDLLLAAQRKNQIDDEGIREEMDTFVAAGHDTTAGCISYTIMLLAEHKEIQERARAEVNAVLDENDGKMNFSALQRLPYLERCIKESLRLYPSAPFLTRKIEDTVRLSGYTIPKDTMVTIHIHHMHRDPNFWPEPDIFDPDRFLPDKTQGRHPYSYIPFGAGVRNCIGQRFAMLEMKAFIGTLLRNFYLEPIDYLKDVQFKFNIIMHPAYPVRLKFIPIN